MKRQDRPSARPPRPTAGPPAARRIAYDVLRGYESRQVDGAPAPGAPHVTQLLDEHLNRIRPQPLERRLATELVYGCVRRRLTLDTLLAAFLDRPRSQVEPDLWRLLQLGAYQLALMTAIPPHAAVSETVQLARQLQQPRWAGFVNGVLRNLARDLRDEFVQVPSPHGIPLPQPTSDTLPESASSRDQSPLREQYRQIGRPVFPDPAADPAAYLSVAASYPRWLVDRWMFRHGVEEAFRLAAWFNTPGCMTLRVNALRSDRQRLLEVLAACAVPAAAGASPAAVRLGRTVRVEDLPGFAEGWFSVQDESAQAAALLLAPVVGETVLDLCAAPGGKTTHLAELMQDQGCIVAADVRAERLERVRDSARRLGLNCIETVLIPPAETTERDAAAPTLPAALDGPFDAALADVPCSNTGVLGKRPDVRWRIRPQDLVELPQLQQRLLRAALDRVRPGGRVVYSTCSSEPEENADVVRSVLAESSEWSLVSERTAHPGAPGDGGYLALLRRAGS